jgi:hypothetical protein
MRGLWYNTGVIRVNKEGKTMYTIILVSRIDGVEELIITSPDDVYRVYIRKYDGILSVEKYNDESKWEFCDWDAYNYIKRILNTSAIWVDNTR